MQQLTGTDATFLNIETPTTYGHVSGLIVFDPSEAEMDVSFEELKHLIRERLHLAPPYRWKLVEVPFGIDQPYWIEDGDFDLDFHVRQVAVPAPGTKEQLAALCERLVARPLDRSRPLWELYFIEGLEGGMVAQLSKVHHAAIDGVSGAEMLANMLDVTREPREIEQPAVPWKADRVPTQLDMLGRGIAGVMRSPVRGARLTRKILRSVPDVLKVMPPLAGGDSLRRLSNGSDSALSAAPPPAPRTSFNGVIGPHRKFAYGSVPFDDVKTIKSAFGVTINDAVMAVCSTALRRYLLERDELPEDPLVAMVPVSVRTEGEVGTFGNKITNINTPLHTHIDDPVARLQSIHASMMMAKEMQQAIPADLLQDIASFSPPAVTGRAARVLTRAATRWIDPPYNLVISNVPGPQFPLYGGGAEMVGSYPISAITDGAGLNITVQSYNGKFDIGIVACRDLVPGVWDLLQYMRDAIAEYLELADDAPEEAAAAKRTAKQVVAKKNTTQKRSTVKQSSKKTAGKKTAAKRKRTA